ncbi:MAG: hypothetical protein KBD19_01995 [Candidatus Moranbacteria bacterium]|nr:hypothetical protein [Candidatus Moranbacteria bacterium]
MPAVLMLVPFSPGMEEKGFHPYEEAEEKHIPFAFSDSLPFPLNDVNPIQTDRADNEET